MPSTGAAVENVLLVRGLAVDHGNFRVLSDIDLHVDAGEAVGVTGPNGAGKSTLLRAVTGQLAAAAGEVSLLGRDLDERSPAVRRALALVTDDIDFFPDLSVVEHLDLLARAHGVREAEEVVDAVVEELGLTRAAGQLPGTLSSGQRRRLALASALVRPRRLLVLDEPEQRLDTDGVAWLRARLLAEKREGGAVLMVSHNPDLVDAVCDRRVVLEGR